MDKLELLINNALELEEEDNFNWKTLKSLTKRAEKIKNYKKLLTQWMLKKFPPIPVEFLLKYTGNIIQSYSNEPVMIKVSALDVKEALKNFCINEGIFNKDMIKIYTKGWQGSILEDLDMRSEIFIILKELYAYELEEEDFVDTDLAGIDFKYPEEEEEEEEEEEKEEIKQPLPPPKSKSRVIVTSPMKKKREEKTN